MIEVTYEVGSHEPIHPDLRVAGRFKETCFGNACEFGCKVYTDPVSAVRVLAHNSSYGCPKKYVWGLPK